MSLAIPYPGSKDFASVEHAPLVAERVVFVGRHVNSATTASHGYTRLTISVILPVASGI